MRFNCYNGLQKIILIVICCLAGSPLYAGHWSLKTPLKKIVESGTLRPTGGGLFQDFDAPYLNDDSVVFRGRTGSYGGGGVYTNLTGILTTVVNDRTKLGSDDRFLAFQLGGLSEKSTCPALYDGKIIFYAVGNRSELSGIYTLRKKKLSNIVNNQTIIPGGTKGLFTAFSDPQFVDGGEPVFIGKGGNEKIVTGIYRGEDSKHLKMLVDNETAIPKGKGDFESFSALSTARNTDSKDFIFQGSGENGQFGVYLYHRGDLTRVIDQSSAIPGGGAGFFRVISDAQFDGETGQVAFVGRGIIGQSGVYLYKKGKIIKIADQQTKIPDNEDENFLEFYNISIDDGMVAFSAGDRRQNKGVYLYTGAGLFKVISNADDLGHQRITDIKIGRGALSDKKIALYLKFEDGKSGIYVGKLDYSFF